ncbi:MAG: sodium:proton antiporter [Candidatus Marinimicrobia bacterium]|nr:sodium:proton antiporter [Candidatus Neomarinimicrobiota bacterium]
MKFTLLLGILCSVSWAGSDNLGQDLPLFSILPFIGILLSIAIIPLIAPTFWHRNFGKVSAFWAISFLLPFLFVYGIHETSYQFLHVLLLEYLPFIILLFSLFTISGGIRLKGSLIGTPYVNTGLILIGTLLASWMGTTGAAMLLIRPVLRANKGRKHKIHTIVFFIFLVANIGGSLTPLGDPPLFLGFLNGVDFFWTTTTMLMPMLLVSAILLLMYFLIDSYYYKKDNDNLKESSGDEKIGLDGSFNFILIAGVIGAVLMSGFWKPQIEIPALLGIHLEIQNICRDLILLILAGISWEFTQMDIRKLNGYTWFPILEVAKLFAGIFITIIPAIAILRAGENGALSGIIQLVTNSDGSPVNAMYFWLTGSLSSFLDNAPTYLVFFNLAGASSGDMSMAAYLMEVIPSTLLAISMGAVFMGAMTYIGNAPNFMVKSIAEENNISMPSFFGFLGWSILLLIPVFILVSILFI